MSDRRPTFLEELKRRRVVRVGLVYGAVAYAVLGVTDILIGTLRLPDALQAGVGVLVLAGFPVALVLAWAFDLTSEGIQRTDAAVDEVDAPTPGSWVTSRSAQVARV